MVFASPPALAERPTLLRCLGFLLLAILLILALGVRPALRRAKPAPTAAEESMMPELPAPSGEEAVMAFENAEEQERPEEPHPLEIEKSRAQLLLDQITETLRREPAQSSRLLQSWIHSD